ncbi:MAG: hypothetical protein WBW99_02500, partial [Pseudolabrys sp.]
MTLVGDAGGELTKRGELLRSVTLSHNACLPYGGTHAISKVIPVSVSDHTADCTTCLMAVLA